MMRTLLSVLLIALALAACSGSPGATTAPGTSTGTSSSAAPPTSAASAAPGESAAPSTGAGGSSAAPSQAAGSGTVLSGACQSGFSKYLSQIEPIVKDFDPATATLGDLSTVKQAVQEKSVELLMANNATAPYSCSDEGLEWAYFDSSSPWDGVLAVAADKAPGTVAYLTAIRDMAAIDVAKVADYGVEGCDAAVAKIKEQVKAAAKGDAHAEAMTLKDGLSLLGLYRAYLADVRNGVCPADVLGNDEFDFFGALG
jgi:hypothetical protein